VVNKILMGLGVAAVLGLMVAGLAYAVAGTSGDERTGEGSGGRWQDASAESASGRWSTDGYGASDPQAPTEAWTTVSGVVQSLDGTVLTLETGAGELIEVTLGQPGYWEAQGVSLAAGDAVVAEGFYEDEASLEARSLTLAATGQTVLLRDESGRPMWAGGRRGGGTGLAPELQG
jgi:hypothetical protein